MASRTRVIVGWLAAALLVGGIAIALLLPMFTCEWGRLEAFQVAGRTEITCIQSDLGYRPSSWLPTKIAVATGGLVAGAVLLFALRGHPHLAAGLVSVYACVTLAWFLPNGSRPPRANEPGVPHVVDRHEGRVTLVAAGTVVAVGLVVVDVIKTRRRPPPAAA